MQIKIHLEGEDEISGGGLGVQLGQDTVIFFPLDAKQRVELCDQMSEAIQDVRKSAYRELTQVG